MKKIYNVFGKILIVVMLVCGTFGVVAYADDTPAPVKVTGVALTDDSTTLTVGETDQLTATVEPADATNTAVTWSSSDEGIATVSNGLVTGVAPGNATITVTTADGSFTDTSIVTVNPPPAINHLNVETSVNVPESCSATDTDEVLHEYPKGDSYLAICALEEAVKNGSPSSVGLSNQFPAFGLFITALHGVLADPNSQYWAIYQNGDFAELGLTSLPVVAGDVIMFQLHDFSDNNVGDQVTLHINSLVPTSSGSSGAGGSSGGSSNNKKSGEVLGVSTVAKFDTKKALDFLIANQKEDGSFGEELYTDWATIALAGTSDQTQKIKPIVGLVKYFIEHKFEGTRVTDFERRAMALMTLGLDPYNTNGENYIAKIISSFDGKQFGDANEDNDDIFALIVLQNAGFTQDEKIMTDDIAFILGRQKENGSWDESVDMTGAGISALKVFNESKEVKDAIHKAKKFLKKNQKDDGGWMNNVSSTAWAMEGILGLGEKPENWKEENLSPFDYLAVNQDTDGGIKNENTESRIWETAYAASGASGKTWNEVMEKFEKGSLESKVVEVQPEVKEEEIPVKTTVKAPQKTVTKKEETKKEATAEAPAPGSTTHATDAVDNSIKENEDDQGWFMKFFGKVFGF